MTTELHPSYLQVAQSIIAADHSPGTIFTHAWLRAGLHIPNPGPEDRVTVAELQRNDLAYVDAMAKLRALLLEEHHVALASAPGLGYRVLTPSEQIDAGSEVLTTKLRRVVVKGAELLTHCDVGGLSIQDRQRQLNALAKAGTLAAISRKPAWALPDSKHDPLLAPSNEGDDQ